MLDILNKILYIIHMSRLSKNINLYDLNLAIKYKKSLEFIYEHKNCLSQRLNCEYCYFYYAFGVECDCDTTINNFNFKKLLDMISLKAKFKYILRK